MDTHWRNSMKPVRFFFMDARAAVPFVFCLLHLRWYTLVIAFITTLIFYALEMRGLNFVAALRALRVWITTRKRPNIKQSDRTRLTDYTFEPLPEDMQNAAPPPVTNKAGIKTAASTRPGAASPTRTGAQAAANHSGQRKAAKTVRPAAAPPKKN